MNRPYGNRGETHIAQHNRFTCARCSQTIRRTDIFYLFQEKRYHPRDAEGKCHPVSMAVRQHIS